MLPSQKKKFLRRKSPKKIGAEPKPESNRIGGSTKRKKITVEKKFIASTDCFEAEMSRNAMVGQTSDKEKKKGVRKTLINAHTEAEQH